MSPDSRPVSGPESGRPGSRHEAVVIDASVGLKWVLPEPGADVAARLYDDLAETGATVYVPDLFWSEAGNALRRLARGPNPVLSGQEAEELFGALRSAPVRTEPVGPLSARGLEIALAADITTYDAAYIALAELREARPWTADAALVAKLAGTEWEGGVVLLS